MKIPTTLKVEYVRIDSIKLRKDNPRAHGEDIKLLVRSIQHYGWTQPVLVRKATNELIAGCGRVEAAIKAGLDVIPVILLDLDETDAKAYMIADNAIAERSRWDFLQLETLIADLKIENFDLVLTGLADIHLETLELGQSKANEEKTGAKGSLADSFIVPPFSMFDARQGYWQDRKQQWIELGIRSEEGRDVVTYGTGSQPPALYELRNLMREQLGRDPSWDEVMETARLRGIATATGTSIFDPVLTELCYKWFCPPKGSILDPFAGGSVRGVVAAMLKRPYTGIDLSAEQINANRTQWAEIAKGKKRLPAPTWIEGDSTRLEDLIPPGEFDFVFSCPPYADLEVYSKDKRDLSNMSYRDFLKAYQRIIGLSIGRLKQDRFACFVVGEVRDTKGVLRGLVTDTIRAFEAVGALYYNDAILATMLSAAPTRARTGFEKSRKLAKVHQNVVIFCKGDPKKATEACGTVDVAFPDEVSV